MISCFLPVFVALATLLVPLVGDGDIMSGTQSGKSFYFAYTVVALVIAAIISTLTTRNYAIRIKPLDAVFGLFFCYSAMHPCLFGYTIASMIWVETLSLALFYLVVRQVSEKQVSVLLLGALLAGMAQAIYGNLQLWGHFPSNHAIFRMTGSFFNPGPFAGYLAAVIPFALGLYLNRVKMTEHGGSIIRKFDCLEPSSISNTSYLFQTFLKLFKHGSNQINRKSLVRFTTLATIISILLVLPASRSRAAWLGAMAGCFFVFQAFIRHPKDQAGQLQAFKWFSNIQSSFKAVKHFKQILIVAGTLIFAVALFAMYQFKKGSADGRLLIWEVGANMIEDKPLFGHGTSKFAAGYMNYQAAYFRPNPDVPEAMQADNVTYAYNEFLKLAVEKGIVGLLLGLGVLWFLFFGKSEEGRRQTLEASLPEREAVGGRRQKFKNPILLAARGGLLAILVFALFSYPSEIMPIKMLFVLLAAIAANCQKPAVIFEIGAGRAIRYGLLMVSLLLAYPACLRIAQQYRAYKLWNDASDIYNVGAYPESLEDFEQAYPQLKANGQFLVQYGKALEMAGKPDSSIILLNQAKEYLNNTILYTTLGNNCTALGRHTEAEQAYLHAWHMAPARFYPMYLLAKLYNETGQAEKAVVMAKKVLEKEVKIESTAIEEIKEQMKRIIEESKAKSPINAKQI